MKRSFALVLVGIVILAASLYVFTNNPHPTKGEIQSNCYKYKFSAPFGSVATSGTRQVVCDEKDLEYHAVGKNISESRRQYRSMAMGGSGFGFLLFVYGLALPFIIRRTHGEDHGSS